LPLNPVSPTPQPGACQANLATDVTLTGAAVQFHPNKALLTIQAGDGTGNPAGMIVSAGAALNPPGCGKFVFVQNVMPSRQIVYKDHTRNTFQTSNFVLDTSDPYPSQDFSPNKNISVPTANDSPSKSILSFGEEFINTVEARDDFRMFLLFQPTGGTRNVVQVAEWSWVGLLKNNKPNDLEDGELIKDSGASRVTPASGKGRSTTDTPVLSPNVTRINWVTDNGGDPTQTLADIDRKILDKLKPKADTQ
jgi:hypothetical protein